MTLERDPDAHKFTLSNALKDLTYLSAFASCGQCRQSGRAPPCATPSRWRMGRGGRRTSCRCWPTSSPSLNGMSLDGTGKP